MNRAIFIHSSLFLSRCFCLMMIMMMMKLIERMMLMRMKMMIMMMNITLMLTQVTMTSNLLYPWRRGGQKLIELLVHGRLGVFAHGISELNIAWRAPVAFHKAGLKEQNG